MRLLRRSLLRLMIFGAGAETVWTIYVGLELPGHYVAVHWDIAWVGMDVSQVIMLSLCAWAAWRRHPMMVMFATAGGTLLMLDAWFDVTTSRRVDILQGVLLAVLVEIPSALVLYWVAYRGIRHTLAGPFAISPYSKATPGEILEADGSI